MCILYYMCIMCIKVTSFTHRTQHLFHDEHYNKPLFWTYFKTTLFSIYLSAFLFWRPWQRLCWEGCRRGRGRGRWAGLGEGRVCLWGNRKGGTVIRTNHHQVCQVCVCVYVYILHMLYVYVCVCVCVCTYYYVYVCVCVCVGC